LCPLNTPTLTTIFLTHFSNTLSIPYLINPTLPTPINSYLKLLTLHHLFI
jgi:hypothetical protein